MNVMRKLALIIPLLALLGFSVWFAARSWMLDGPEMPFELYLAMGLGILFSLLIGMGLMALVFYSSRHGYDEPPQDPQRRSRDHQQ